MDIPYRHSEKIKINQSAKAPLKKQIDAARLVVMLLPAKPGKSAWTHLAYGEALKSRLRELMQHDRQATRLVTDLPNVAGTRVLLQTLDPRASMFDLLTTARKLAAAVRSQDPAGVLIQVAGLEKAAAARPAEALVAALLAAVCPMPAYRAEADPVARLKRIDLFGLDETLDTAALQAESAGNHLARWLSMLPPNVLTPAAYRSFVTRLAKAEGWAMTFHNSSALKRKQAGAFLAVVQGSPVDDAGIVHLRYRAKKTGGKKLALVGKGICFDTGGVNLKPAKYMNGMHEDMQGSAVALGTLLALSRLKVDYPVDCWLALAENHIGSKAYKPNDLVKACNGTSIEIKHTDAEGRMVLADTLALASKTKPQVLIDYATLTGACIYSLSSRYSGVFSNRDSLHAALTTAGRSSGERVWPFPTDADFDDALKSDIADTLQCTLEGDADHILAARFLKRFIDEKIHWVHVDLSASNHKGGLGHIATDTTGFGVRFTLNLLREQSLMDTTWS